MKTCSYGGHFSKTHIHVQDLCYLCKSHNMENHTICTQGQAARCDEGQDDGQDNVETIASCVF